MSTLWPHTGAILIGGKSSRMGSPKHELMLCDGRTMLEHVADALGCVCREMVLVGSMRSRADQPCLPIVSDARHEEGPVAGLEALLASDLDSQYLICPCDVPGITPEILRSLTGDSRSVVTALQFDGDNAPQSLPLRISSEGLHIVREQLDRGERAIYQFLARDDLSIDLSRAPSAWRDALRNINTPDELISFQQPSVATTQHDNK